jgi:O-antigen ligase
MPLSFLYPFLHFFQPGILFPEVGAFRPMQVIGALVLITHLAKRSELKRGAVFAHPAFKWLVAFLVCQMLSVYRTGVSGMFSELGFWLAYLQFAGLSILLITNAAALKRYVWGAICGSMTVVAYGIYAVVAQLPSAVGGRAGAYGMYENHNDYSFLVIQILPFIYMFMREETGLLRRWFLRASLVACVAGIFLSLSRGGVLALVLEATLIVCLTMEKKQRLILLPIVFVIGAGAIGYQWAKRAANQGDSYTADDAEASRLELWRAARSMVFDRPLLGVGSRSFGEHAQSYGEISGDNRGKNSHNTYIEVVATSGLLGFLAFYKMLRWLLREIRRPCDRATDWWVDAARTATAISLYSIMFRAILDAKAHDWSFYFLLVVGLAATLLRPSPGIGKAGANPAPNPPLQGNRIAPRPGLRPRTSP